MYQHIRHIFFDLDHTLWDFETNSREALSDLFVTHGMSHKCQTSAEAFIAMYETINQRYWELYSRQEVSKEKLRYGRFYDTFMHFGYDNLELAEIWATEYLELSPYKTNLLPGAIEILEYLKLRYTLHLITNGFKEVQHIKLSQSRLRHYFSQVLISEEHGVGKPDTKIFRLAETCSGATADECVMIGDNYESDIAGAMAAGWQAIHLNRNGHNPAGHAERSILDLAELKDLF